MASQKHITDVFNQFLRLARTAKTQFERHLELIEHEPAQSILADLVDEEARHMDSLTTAILSGGGMPDTSVEDIAMPAEYQQMMAADYELEQNIVREYETHLEEIWDPQLRALAQSMWEQATARAETFRGLLEDFGTDELMDLPA